MSVLFAGGETPSFLKFNAIETVLAGAFKAPARCGIHTKKGGWIKSAFIPFSTLWAHFDMHVGLVSSGLTPINFTDASGNSVFSIASDGSMKAGTTTVGLAPIFTPGLFTIDIHLVNGSLIEVYADSQIVTSVTGSFTFAPMTNLINSPVGFDPDTDVTDTVWSQVIISNESTIGNELATLVYSAGGVTAEWTGAVSDINEIVLDTTTFINAPTGGLVSTFTTGDLGTQYTNIRAVAIAALARYSDQGGPTHLDGVIRLGSTNYLSNLTNPGLGDAPCTAIIHANPQTNLPWSRIDINNAEFGLRSRL